MRHPSPRAHKPAVPAPAPAAYHHGDVAASLLSAGLRRLDGQGHASFSLSELAREIGVTPAAVYRHFADKDALVAALAGHGFDRLRAMFEAAAPWSSSDSPAPRAAVARFHALGLAYVRFGCEHPALFMLMFGADGAGYRRAFQARASTQTPSTFDYLSRALANLHRSGAIARAPDGDDRWFAWATIHGATELLINGTTTGRDAHSVAKVVTARLLRTFRAAA